MKIFIQMSVGGFKVFDIDSFSHTHDKLKYALIKEIGNVSQTRTHLVNSDMHGMRQEVCSLFSSGYIDILLQEDFLYNNATTILFIKRCGTTSDSMDRECKVSACFMSESYEEIAILQNLAIAVVMEDETTKKTLGELLSSRIVDEKQILAFDVELWNKLLEHIRNDKLEEKTKDLFSTCGQMIVLHDGANIHVTKNKHEDLFNRHPYLIYTNDDCLNIQKGEKYYKPESYLFQDINLANYEKKIEKARNVFNAAKQFMTELKELLLST